MLVADFACFIVYLFHLQWCSESERFIYRQSDRIKCLKNEKQTYKITYRSMESLCRPQLASNTRKQCNAMQTTQAFDTRT